MATTITTANVSTSGDGTVGDKVSHEESSPSSSLVSCAFSDLIPAEPLKNIIASAKFLIVGTTSTMYNEVNIMSVDVKYDEEFRLNEEILDVVENEELKLSRMPALKEIVLAPNPVDKLYHRAIIVKIYKKTLNADVYFIDVGGIFKVKVGVLKPINKDIMDFPVLGYHVSLQDVPGEDKLILKSYYDNLMNTLRDAEFSVKLGERISGAGAFMEKDMVILSHKSFGTTKSLADDINELKKWEWEKYSNGKGTDDEICENGAFGKKHRRYNDQAIVSSYDVDVGSTFTAQVSRVATDALNPNAASETLLRVYLLDNPIYQNYFNVLHTQLHRYATTISRSSFYPSVNETCLFKLEEKAVYAELGVKCMGRWCRGIRLESNLVYLIDTDDYVVFENLPMEDYEIRRLYGEFIKIPILVLTIYPQENGRCIPLDKARETFKPKERYTFRITKVRLDGCYEAEYKLG